MECGQCYPSQPFVVLIVDKFVGHGGGPLKRQKQKEMTRMHPNQSVDTLISPIILNSIWLFAAFPYI